MSAEMPILPYSYDSPALSARPVISDDHEVFHEPPGNPARSGYRHCAIANRPVGSIVSSDTPGGIPGPSRHLYIPLEVALTRLNKSQPHVCR